MSLQNPASHPTGLATVISLTQPWYREPWLLFIIAMPALAVIAGCITLWIAIERGDTVVSDDYYKQGLGINRDMARDLQAIQAGITAEIVLTGQTLTVQLNGRDSTLTGTDQPVLHLVHPFDASLDQSLVLIRNGSNTWQAITTGPIPAKVRWQISIETGSWRVLTHSTLDPGTAVHLGTSISEASS